MPIRKDHRSGTKVKTSPKRGKPTGGSAKNKPAKSYVARHGQSGTRVAPKAKPKSLKSIKGPSRTASSRDRYGNVKKVQITGGRTHTPVQERTAKRAASEDKAAAARRQARSRARKAMSKPSHLR